MVSSVLVCRGCCCGSTSKQPGVDHDGQLERIRRASERIGARLHTVGCLGPCERANVVVVRSGVKRQWFGDLGDAEVTELAQWITSSEEGVPHALSPYTFAGPADRSRRQLVPDRGDGLAELAVDLITLPGRWTSGVPGGLAEFEGNIESANVVLEAEADVHRVTAIGSSGSLRLRIDDRTRAFAFGSEAAPEEPELMVFVRNGAGPGGPRVGLTEIGHDLDPIGAVEDAVLFDLGIGRRFARFMIRVEDDELVGQLRASTGRQLRELDPRVWDAIVAASPTRVVETAVGRIEVTSSIPPLGRGSTAPSRTYLWPEVLALGLDLPPGIDVPSGWAVGPLHVPTVGGAPESSPSAGATGQTRR